MRKLLLSFSLFTVCGFGQYKIESAGVPPSDLLPSVRDALQRDGARVVGPKGLVCEVWFRTSVPATPNGEQNVSFTDIAQGALLGVIRFSSKATDRRGQSLQPGVYTLRLGFYPVDGAHQGVAPSRDFLVLSRAIEDTDLSATPKFDQLMDMSRKASGTRHPAVLNTWKPDSAEATSLKQEGEDWVLYTKIGDRPIAVILVGTYQG